MTPSPSPTRQRDAAVRLARSDADEALRLAREIQNPWFRTQALAWAGRYAPESRAAKILAEAFAAARKAHDPYETAGASAWPLRACVERGLDPGRDAEAKDLVALAEAVEHPVRRSSALFLLWQAALPADSRSGAALFDALVAACRASESWRAARTLAEALGLLAAADPARARRLAEAMRPGRWRGRALRLIAAGGTAEPRPFFW